MSDLDALGAAAKQAIENAFAAGAPPTAEEMRNDHCPECEDVAARFAGKSWPDVDAKNLEGNPGPAFLSDAAFRYYLPVMMLRSIEETQSLDCFPDGVIGELSPPGRKATSRAGERLRGFTREQIVAILGFLRFFEALERADWSTADWPEEAVQAVPISRPIARAIRYWSDRLNE